MSMTPEALLAAARKLVDAPDAADGFGRGVWARSSAVLARQALEQQVRIALSKAGGALEKTNFTAQLLCLYGVTSNDRIPRVAHYVWSALSHATHHRAYELPPSAKSLRAWFTLVEEVIVGLR